MMRRNGCENLNVGISKNQHCTNACSDAIIILQEMLIEQAG